MFTNVKIRSLLLGSLALACCTGGAYCSTQQTSGQQEILPAPTITVKQGGKELCIDGSNGATILCANHLSHLNLRECKIITFKNIRIVDENLFSGNDVLESIGVNSFVVFGNNSFSNCKNLKTIVLDDNIFVYGNAFAGCSLKIVGDGKVFGHVNGQVFKYVNNSPVNQYNTDGVKGTVQSTSQNLGSQYIDIDPQFYNFYNDRNCCYMSSTLQVLRHSPVFVNHFDGCKRCLPYYLDTLLTKTPSMSTQLKDMESLFYFLVKNGVKFEDQQGKTLNFGTPQSLTTFARGLLGQVYSEVDWNNGFVRPSKEILFTFGRSIHEFVAENGWRVVNRDGQFMKCDVYGNELSEKYSGSVYALRGFAHEVNPGVVGPQHFIAYADVTGNSWYMFDDISRSSVASKCSDFHLHLGQNKPFALYEKVQ